MRLIGAASIVFVITLVFATIDLWSRCDGSRAG